MKRALITMTFAALFACAGEDQNAGHVGHFEIGAQNPALTPNEPPHDVYEDRNGNPYWEPVTAEMDELMNVVEDNRDVFPDNNVDVPVPLLPEAVYAVLDEKSAALREGRPMDKEKWHSAVYHGLDAAGHPCYSHQQAGLSFTAQQCYFPTYKSQVVLLGGNPAIGPFLCSAVSLAAGDGLIHMPKNLADLAMGSFLDGFLNQERQDITMFVRAVSMPPGVTHYEPTTLACSAAQPEKIASTNVYWQDFAARQAGLPAHGGVDPSGAWQIIDNTVTFFPARLHRALQSKCGFTLAQLASDTTIIAGYSGYAGAHEFMHTLGFGHFTGGVMKPKFDCASRANSINQQRALMSPAMLQAITIYSGGHENDDGIIHDVGLPSPDPEFAPEDVLPFSHG